MDKDEILAETRGEAEPRILAKYPLWKQINLLTGVIEQLADIARLDAPDFREMRAHIVGTLDYCNQLEARIDAGEDVDPYAGWPTEFVAKGPPDHVAANLERMVENGDIPEKVLDNLEAVQTKLQERPAARYEEPPVEIADLIDPSLTARQNLDALMAKFAAAKNMEEYCRSNGQMADAMKHLKDADRFESGIKWNRAVLAEVI